MKSILWFLQQEVSIKAILMGLLSFFLGVMSLGITILGPNPLFDETTLILSFAIGSTMLLALWLARAHLFVPVAMLSVVLSLFLFPRLLSFLYMPSLVVFPFDLWFETKDIARGLFYLLSGTVALLAGFIVVDGTFRHFELVPSFLPAKQVHLPLGSLLIIFLFVAGIDWFVTDWLGVSHFRRIRAETWNTQIQIVKGLFSIDMAFFVILVALLQYGEKNSAAYQAVAFATAVYLLFTAINGSRSGWLVVLMIILATFLGMKQNFEFALKKYLAVLLFLGIAGWLIYPFATQSRIAASFEFKKMHGQARPYNQPTKEDGMELYYKFRKQIAALANRMGASLLDPAVMVLSEYGSQEEIDHYINVEYSSKYLVNYVIPGVMFHEAEVSTSRVMPIIYGGFTEEYVKSHGYFSMIWTGWGLAYVMFGWVGGLVALMISGFVLHAGYLLVIKFSGSYVTYFCPWYLFLIPMLLYASSGLDHTVTTALVRFLQLVTTLCLCVLVSYSWRRYQGTE